MPCGSRGHGVPVAVMDGHYLVGLQVDVSEQRSIGTIHLEPVLSVTLPRSDDYVVARFDGLFNDG